MPHHRTRPPLTISRLKGPVVSPALTFTSAHFPPTPYNIKPSRAPQGGGPGTWRRSPVKVLGRRATENRTRWAIAARQKRRDKTDETSEFYSLAVARETGMRRIKKRALFIYALFPKNNSPLSIPLRRFPDTFTYFGPNQNRVKEGGKTWNLDQERTGACPYWQCRGLRRGV